MLWFLHLCAVAKVVVVAYDDRAEGTMVEDADGSGHFTEVILKPRVNVQGEADAEQIEKIHHEANKKCFIANSCNFPVRQEAELV